MARTIQAGDFNKPYQYDQAKKQERKIAKTNRKERNTKQNRWVGEECLM